MLLLHFVVPSRDMLGYLTIDCFLCYNATTATVAADATTSTTTTTAYSGGPMFRLDPRRAILTDVFGSSRIFVEQMTG
jgi:hypothetical protein